jgi:hypothetical protein
VNVRDGLACYLYCLAPSGAAIQCGAPGVDERYPVSVEQCGRACAVLSEVELSEYCGLDGERNLQDLAWIGPRALRHESVVEEAMRQAPVLPVRFGTLFTSRDSLRRTVLERDEETDEFLRQVGNRQEWAVKGQLDRAEALRSLRAARLSAAEGKTREVAPGRSYLLEKRMQSQADGDLSVRLNEFCRCAAAELRACCGAFRQRDLSLPTTDRKTEVVLNWAFLLAPESVAMFRSSLEQINRNGALAGLELELTGPFPPYSFAPNLSSPSTP